MSPLLHGTPNKFNTLPLPCGLGWFSIRYPIGHAAEFAGCHHCCMVHRISQNTPEEMKAGSINEGGDSINEGGGSINEGVTDTPSIQLWLSPKVCTFGMSAEFENPVPGKGASAIRRALPIPLTIECVLLLQNVFSHYRMCSLANTRRYFR